MLIVFSLCLVRGFRGETRRDKLTGASCTERVRVRPAVLPAGAPGSPSHSPLVFGENSTEIGGGSGVSGG